MCQAMVSCAWEEGDSLGSTTVAFTMLNQENGCAFILYNMYFGKYFYVKVRFHKQKGDVVVIMCLINYARYIFCNFKKLCFILALFPLTSRNHQIYNVKLHSL